MSNKRPRKASAAEVEMRIQEIFEMMCESKATAYIEKTMMDKYGVQRRQVITYTAKARTKMMTMLEGKKQDKLTTALHQREHIIQKLMDTKNYAMASQALSDKNKLEGLYEDNVDHSVSIKVIQK